MNRGLLLLICILACLGISSPIAQEQKKLVNGKPVSQAELDAILKLAPAELRPMISRNPDELLRYYGLVDRLAEEAEKAKLPQESPLKEELSLARKQMLATAMSERYFRDHPVSPEEEQKYYSAHADEFTTASIKGLFVAIDASTPAGAAEATADRIAEQLRGGMDFSALAAKYPIKDLPAQITKGDTKIPEPVRSAVFALKPGENTNPIRLPSGVYILHVDEIAVRSFRDARGDINKDLSEKAFLAWMAGIRKGAVASPSWPRLR